MQQLYLMQMGNCLQDLKQDVFVMSMIENGSPSSHNGYPTTASRSVSMSSKTRYKSYLLSAPSTLCSLIIFG